MIPWWLAGGAGVAAIGLAVVVFVLRERLKTARSEAKVDEQLIALAVQRGNDLRDKALELGQQMARDKVARDDEVTRLRATIAALGRDAEGQDAYLDRLVAELSKHDSAAAARLVGAGLDRELSSVPDPIDDLPTSARGVRSPSPGSQGNPPRGG